MQLFNPAEIPSEICSENGVQEINHVFQKIGKLHVQHLRIPEASSGFRVSNKIRVYCQVFLLRCLDLIESSEVLRKCGHELSARVMVRSVYETIAAFLHFEKLLSSEAKELTTIDDLKRINDFVQSKTFSTRDETVLGVTGAGSIGKATNIVTQIKVLEKVYENAVSDYEHLCEFTHPNGLGSHLWYAKHNRNNDTVTLSTEDPSTKNPLFWNIQGAYLLRYFLDAFLRIENSLPELSEFGASMAEGSTMD